MKDTIQLEGLSSRHCLTGFAASAEAHLHPSPRRGLPQDESSTAIIKPSCSSLSRGFTIVELLIVLAVLMTITAIAVPNLMAAIESARVAKAVGDIRAMEAEISLYESQNGKLPDTLGDIGRGGFLDPWNTPYQYLNFANVKGKGAMRKDRFLVPLNSDYDLYSMGKDRTSVPPITAAPSQDDILRANDGNFLGLASQY